VFSSLDDFYRSANDTGANRFAESYELRYSLRKDGEFPYAEVGALQLGLFAQDKWNVNNNLVLTVGLRADLPIFENIFNSNTVADALTYRNGTRINTGKGPKTSILWSPRIGYNWDVTGNKSTQLRGGVGIFAGPPPFVWISNQASNNGIDFGSFRRSGSDSVLFNPDVNAYREDKPLTTYNLAITDRDFKFPQVFRANFAIDQRLPLGIIATLEGIFSKDLNGVYHQNINLPATGRPLVGADNRIRFDSSRIYGTVRDDNGNVINSVQRPNITDAILMTNTSKGYTYNITLQLQRNVANLYTMVAYSYGNSQSVNDGGSIAQSIWRDRPVAGDPNANVTSYSNFYQPHRVVAAAFYRKEYAKFFATSLGFTFEAANGGVASYTINGDLNNDGLSINDLIYVPRNQSEILLVPVTGTSSSVPADTRTADEIWNQLNNYITQDKYLSERRGQYAERNGLLLPFYKRLDLNITQDFFVTAGGKRNTLRFTADVFNFGNLLNKNWGIFQTTNRAALLRYEAWKPQVKMPAGQSSASRTSMPPSSFRLPKRSRTVPAKVPVTRYSWAYVIFSIKHQTIV
jgi:hypothetical protein